MVLFGSLVAWCWVKLIVQSFYLERHIPLPVYWIPTWEPWPSLMLTGKHGRLNSLQGSQECGSPSTQFVVAWRSRSHGKFHILQGFSRQSAGKYSHDSQNEGWRLDFGILSDFWPWPLRASMWLFNLRLDTLSFFIFMALLFLIRHLKGLKMKLFLVSQTLFNHHKYVSKTLADSLATIVCFYLLFD